VASIESLNKEVRESEKPLQEPYKSRPTASEQLSQARALNRMQSSSAPFSYMNGGCGTYNEI
ncbi:hypothetical protein SK128_024005, partial [Halocaridina rubra]